MNIKLRDFFSFFGDIVPSAIILIKMGIVFLAIFGVYFYIKERVQKKTKTRRRKKM